MKMCNFFLAFENNKRLQYIIKNFPLKQTMTLMYVTKMKKNFFSKWEEHNSLFQGAWECRIFVVSMCSHQVFNGFLTCSTSSQCIPQHLSHIVEAQSSNLVTYIISPKEEIITFLFWNYPKLDFFLVMGQLKMSISHDHLQSSCTLGGCKGPILL
jgi:hypothetical protein